MGDVSQNFSRYEFACQCGCGFDTVDAELVNFILEPTREHLVKKYPERNIKIKVTSGCRCEERNKKEGGSDTSQHKEGKAADFYVYDANTGERIPEEEVFQFLLTLAKAKNKYGIGRYKGRNHADARVLQYIFDKR